MRARRGPSKWVGAHARRLMGAALAATCLASAVAYVASNGWGVASAASAQAEPTSPLTQELIERIAPHLPTANARSNVTLAAEQCGSGSPRPSNRWRLSGRIQQGAATRPAITTRVQDGITEWTLESRADVRADQFTLAQFDCLRLGGRNRRVRRRVNRRLGSIECTGSVRIQAWIQMEPESQCMAAVPATVTREIRCGRAGIPQLMPVVNALLTQFNRQMSAAENGGQGAVGTALNVDTTALDREIGTIVERLNPPRCADEVPATDDSASTE